jgi:hypothetical protein
MTTYDKFTRERYCAPITLLERMLKTRLPWTTVTNMDEIHTICSCPSDDELELIKVGLRIANYRLWIYYIGDDILQGKMSIMIRGNSITLRYYMQRIEPVSGDN